MEQPEIRRRRARGRESKEDTEAAVVNWRTPAPKPSHHRGHPTTGPPEPSEKDHGCPRASASVSKIGGASHLGTGTGACASVLRCLHTGGLPTPFPQPAGGATGQQREPVSPFITSRPQRQRRVGGDCRPRYVSSITPAPADCAGAGSGLPPVPPPAHTRGPHPYTPHWWSWWSPRRQEGLAGEPGTWCACVRFSPRHGHCSYPRFAQLLFTLSGSLAP